MVNFNGFACVPACIACRQADDCAKSKAIPTTEVVAVGKVWAPNRLSLITLPCGCRDIPWPIVHVFASDIYRIECDIHGTQTLSKNWKEKAQKEANRYANISKPKPDQLDIPPF